MSTFLISLVKAVVVKHQLWLSIISASCFFATPATSAASAASYTLSDKAAIALACHQSAQGLKHVLKTVCTLPVLWT